MRSPIVAAGAALFLASAINAQQGQPPAGAGTPPAPPAGQRGGGRGNPTAAKFVEVCAACHGVSAAPGPVAPSLFDDRRQWAHGIDDASIVKSIRDGYPEK